MTQPSSRERSYLTFLTWNTRLHILLVVLLIAAAVSPLREEALPVVLFAGMLLRTASCGLLPRTSALTGSASVLLIPLWPVLVTHDTIWSWMEREGFGVGFRRIVTAVLLAASAGAAALRPNMTASPNSGTRPVTDRVHSV